jgi:hypothetical protein
MLRSYLHEASILVALSLFVATGWTWAAIIEAIVPVLR